MTPFEIFRTPIVILRLSGGSYVNGQWIEGTQTTIDATASIQPLSGQEILLIPEARREKEVYKMYTSTPINDLTTQNPDQVQFFGKTYEVLQIWTWQNNALFATANHYKYMCMRLDPLS